MRALGFFPSEAAAAEMVAEVAHAKGLGPDEPRLVTLDEFLQLYVNHRNSHCVQLDDIRRTFTNLGVKTKVGRADFLQKMQRKGELIPKTEATAALQTLCGKNRVPDYINADVFAKMLGYE